VGLPTTTQSWSTLFVSVNELLESQTAQLLSSRAENLQGGKNVHKHEHEKRH